MKLIVIAIAIGTGIEYCDGNNIDDYCEINMIEYGMKMWDLSIIQTRPPELSRMYFWDDNGEGDHKEDQEERHEGSAKRYGNPQQAGCGTK